MHTRNVWAGHVWVWCMLMCVCGISNVSAATCMGRFRCILLRPKRVCLCVRVRVCGRVYIIDVCVREVHRV